MYRATLSFTTKNYDVRKNQILEDDFTTQDEIDEFLNIGYIVEYDGTLEITENGLYDVEDYEKADVNVAGGGVAVEEKDVNFYDYDGTLVDAYTASEFANLTALPDNPAHSGLTSQGWNWNLADAKSYVADCGKLDIGQMYVTDNGATRIYIKLEDGRLAPYLNFAIDGTATVDWGDNTTSTVTGTSTTTVVPIQHTYAQAGKYVISISSESKIHFLGQNIGGSYVMSKGETPSSNVDKVYRGAIYKIEFGSNISSIDDYAFNNTYTLVNITIPNSLTSIGANAFSACHSLIAIIIPNSVTTIGESAFGNCEALIAIIIPSSVTSIGKGICLGNYSLKSVTIPNMTSVPETMLRNCYSIRSIIISNSVTSISSGAFHSCNAVSNIKIPSNVTSIESSAFSGWYGASYYDFTSLQAVPILDN